MAILAHWRRKGAWTKYSTVGWWFPKGGGLSISVLVKQLTTLLVNQARELASYQLVSKNILWHFPAQLQSHCVKNVSSLFQNHKHPWPCGGQSHYTPARQSFRPLPHRFTPRIWFPRCFTCSGAITVRFELFVCLIATPSREKPFRTADEGASPLLRVYVSRVEECNPLKFEVFRTRSRCGGAMVCVCCWSL